MIYFVQNGAGGPIKIGYTERKADIRLSELQVGNPTPMTLLAVTDGDLVLEAHYHKLFKKSHIHGEWFHPTDDLLDFIESFADYQERHRGKT